MFKRLPSQNFVQGIVSSPNKSWPVLRLTSDSQVGVLGTLGGPNPNAKPNALRFLFFIVSFIVWTHFLVLVLTPLPHVTEHGLYGVHFAHRPVIPENILQKLKSRRKMTFLCSGKRQQSGGCTELSLNLVGLENFKG